MEIRDEFSPKITHLARTVLVSFLFTFMLARVIVFLIMAKLIPNLYFHLHDTHIHHLNYGIFLLSALGGYLLFGRPTGRNLKIAATIYGIAMGLTFDEFGMWIHLGGEYWQRISWDAVVMISAIFAIIAFAPSVKNFRFEHWLVAISLLFVLLIFASLLINSFKYGASKFNYKMQEIESMAPY